jgi:apolipoprotein D and lipocalin family protein
MDLQTGLLFVLVMTAAQAPGSQPPPRTVAAVDLRAYAGTYYEIARFPNRFQKKCAGDVTATYELGPDGRITVINRCRTAAGTITEARGIAKAAGTDPSNGKLKVRFAPAFLSFLPQVWGDYWILGLGPDYSFAVVGDPSRSYLWILSRTPVMSDLAYRQAQEIASGNGYDVGRLVKTAQGDR